MDTITPRRGSTPRAPSVNFAPDGELLATGRRGMVYLSLVAWPKPEWNGLLYRLTMENIHRQSQPFG